MNTSWCYMNNHAMSPGSANYGTPPILILIVSAPNHEP